MGDKSLIAGFAKCESRCKLRVLLWEPGRAASSWRSGWGRVKGQRDDPFRVGGVIRILKDEQELCRWSVSYSVVSGTLQPHGLRLTSLFCPWDFPGKNTGVGCHVLLHADEGRGETQREKSGQGLGVRKLVEALSWGEEGHSVFWGMSPPSDRRSCLPC